MKYLKKYNSYKTINELSGDKYSEIIKKAQKEDDEQGNQQGGRADRIIQKALDAKYGKFLKSKITLAHYYDGEKEKRGEKVPSKNKYNLSVSEENDKLLIHPGGSSFTFVYSPEEDKIVTDADSFELNIIGGTEDGFFLNEEDAGVFLNLIKTFNNNSKIELKDFNIKDVSVSKVAKSLGMHDPLVVKYGFALYSNWDEEKFKKDGIPHDTRLKPIKVDIPSIWTGEITFVNPETDIMLIKTHGIDEEGDLLKFSGGGAGELIYDAGSDEIYLSAFSGANDEINKKHPEISRRGLRLVINCIKRFNKNSKISPSDFKIVK